MADFSAIEYRPYRSQDLEPRIRAIENFLVQVSVVGERNTALAEGTGSATVPGAVTIPLPEESVEFDPSVGHDHNGDTSALISGIQVELDFGSTPTRYLTATITDSIVESGLQIIMVQAADAATSRSQDENEMDPIICRAVAGTGSFTAYLTSLEGPVVGLYKFNYRLTRTTPT